MKRNLKTSFLLIPVFVFAGILTLSVKPENQTAPIKAGFSKILITPADPVRMSGYAARKDPFKGVHDDLFAAAAVFDDGTTKTCVITSDVISYAMDYVDETKSRIAKSTGIPAANILMSAVHNHGGPITRAYENDLSENEKKYIATLQDKLVQVVKEASDKIQPAKIGVGKGICKMNINRRSELADGSISLGRNPYGICDQEVGVIRVDDMNSKTIGLMVNWPCHGTTGGQENYQITGDWPGATARELEKSLGSAVIMVSAGASGDINPIYGPNDNFGDINSMGYILGREVKKVYDEIETKQANELEVVSQSLMAKGKKPSESRQPNVSLTPDGEREIRLATMKIGNILLCGISGELFNEIGLKIKEDSPYKNTFIMTHCNGSSGYLCTDIAYKEGGYEPMVSRTMPGTAQQIIDGFRAMNNGL
ncbi:MAG TPA: neutral/alkaline non-lysosomal ceramidase N-terminal domain-containing protein [Cyclobacteriaceae bacterium]|nr:neutral/alkaline non-lysosomal ceramidase N-terminal domain-containing protein [Cyclobacteriaceae bacterium]